MTAAVLVVLSEDRRTLPDQRLMSLQSARPGPRRNLTLIDYKAKSASLQSPAIKNGAFLALRDLTISELLSAHKPCFGASLQVVFHTLRGEAKSGRRFIRRFLLLKYLLHVLCQTGV